MPRFDKSGPEGKGPGSGRGLGKCIDKEIQSKNEEDEKFEPQPRGFWRRRGMNNNPGQGNRHRHRGNS